MKKGGSWLSMVTVLAVLYPLFNFLGFNLPKKPRKIRVEKDVRPGGFYIGREFILFADEKGDAWAVSRRCTHLGCLVAVNETAKQLICPCHQSRFSKEGKRLAGPARLDLERYKVAKVSGSGYVVII